MPDEDLSVLAQDTAAEARAYLVAVTDVAAGSNPSTALSVLLLAVSPGAAGRRPPRRHLRRRAAVPVRARPGPGGRRSTRCTTAWPTRWRASTTTARSSTRSCPASVVHGSLSGDLAEIAVRAGPRAAPLRGRPDRRGPVVVAVQLPVLVGTAGGERPARRPVDPRAPAAGRRRGGRRGRRVRRPAPPVDCSGRFRPDNLGRSTNEARSGRGPGRAEVRRLLGRRRRLDQARGPARRRHPQGGERRGHRHLGDG